MKVSQLFKVPITLLALLVWVSARPDFVQGAPLPQNSQDDITVTGTVTSPEGDPLIGVNILIQGTTTGTVTDIDGRYEVQVPDQDAVLVFSYTGYQSQEVNVGSQTVIDVVMQESSELLEEVVVVGYGTQKKRDVTGAVGSLSAEDLPTMPITSPDQVLAGTLSGVNITNRSGDPGAPINVRIRGVGTPGVNQPLWVIDGVPIVQSNNITVNTSSTTDSNPLAGINPNDIESIDVLKDASAAAIYGARAANGVIIVTTKRGKEGRTSVTYNGYAGVAQIRQKLDVLSVDDYIDIQTELGRDVSQFQGQPFVDWQEAVFKDGPMQNHNVTISGGNQIANYLVSGGYHSQEGIERGQDFQRYSVKVNSDIKVGDRLRFGESVLVSFSDRLTQSEGGGLLAGYNAALNAPYFKIFGDGPFGYNLENPDTRGDGLGSNRVFRTDPRVNRTTILNRKILGNIYGELEIFDGLKFNMNYGIDYNQGAGDFFQRETTFTGLDIRQSLLVTSRPVELTTNFSNTLTYTKTFGAHDLTVLVGYEETSFEFDKVRIQGRNLFNPNFASSGTAVAAGNEADQWALRGLLGRINYGFQGKYLMTVNVRRDETSRFAEGNRAGYFPSVSLGWRLSQESFFPENNFVDDIKIRGSWGQSGNQFTGVNFAYLSALQTTIFYAIGDNQGVIRGPAPVNFANPDLQWETSIQSGFGVDASFWRGKLELTFDYYNRLSKDVLIGLPVPFTSGYFLPADANLGEIRNNGIELSFRYRNRIGDFRYGFGANLTTTNNEVLDLGSVPEIVTGIGGAQTHRTIVGQSLGHFYGFKTDGIFQTQAEVDAAPSDAFSSSREPGDIRFVDVNGDGTIDANDRTNLGSPIPGFFYGGNIDLGWKGFDLSILLRGVGDIQIYNSARIALEGMTGSNNFSTRILDRWTGAGTSDEIPRLTRNDPNGNNRYSDRWIEDADFLRIQNIQFGYNLPAEKLQQWTGGFVSGMRFFFSVQNLGTFTNYLGFDPEVTRAQSFQKGEFTLATGQDGGVSPQPRIYQFGWNVTF